MHNFETNFQKIEENTELNDLLSEFFAFSRMIVATTLNCFDLNFEKEKCTIELSDFYFEGWDLKYEGKNGFYDLSGNIYELLDVLSALKEKQDLSNTYCEIKKSLVEVWNALPNFYKAHESAGFNFPAKPLSYDPETPFPHLNIESQL